MTRSALLIVLAAFACGGEPRDDQRTGSVDSAAWSAARELPAEVGAALDSGNVAFRARELEAAREHYRRAIRLAPDAPAGWFGLAMVERQLGNAAAADSAMRRVAELSPDASLIDTRDNP